MLALYFLVSPNFWVWVCLGLFGLGFASRYVYCINFTHRNVEPLAGDLTISTARNKSTDLYSEQIV